MFHVGSKIMRITLFGCEAFKGEPHQVFPAPFVHSQSTQMVLNDWLHKEQLIQILNILKYIVYST